MSRKGSLNLSIQAIVVLVMAMAVLGLGLGFIRTLMGQGQGQFEDAIGGVELDNPPTSDDPFVADANIKVKSSGEGSFKAGVYNDGTFGSGKVGLSLGDCIPSATIMALEVRSLSQTIAQGDYGSYKVLIDGGDTTQGTYVCVLEATEEGATSNIKTKQVRIKVVS